MHANWIFPDGTKSGPFRTAAEGSYELMVALARGLQFKVSPTSAPKLIRVLEQATAEFQSGRKMVFVVPSDPSEGTTILPNDKKVNWS